MSKKVSEKSIETRLRDEVKALGGIALKFIPISFTGLPDRIVLLPGGRIYFVELKAPGRLPTERQKAVHTILEKLGFSVWVVDGHNMLKTFMDEVA